MEGFENYKKEKLTINIVKANIYGILIIFPIMLCYGVPFFLIWKNEFNKANVRNLIFEHNLGYWGNLSVVFAVLILGVIAHELIHGIAFAKYAKNGFKSIKFGMLWKMLTPYCHCSEPLKVKHYIIGAIMPAMILGFLPFIYSLFIGNFLWLIFAIFFTMVAVGDFMIINLLKNENKNHYVLDHPSEAGCYIFRK